MGNGNHEKGQLDPEFEAQLKSQAEELKQQVDAGDYAAAMRSINDLNDVRDQSLYREVGRLTRSLHEAIRNFQIDPQNAEQREALSKMTDASDRLSYVVEMTDSAANRTMDLVEEAMPKTNALKEEAGHLLSEWQRFRRREMSADEFRELSRRVEHFFASVSTESETIYGSLSEILLAQDFQDLTGQVIQKVTTLVKEVEEHLLHLVVMASHVDQMTGTDHQLDDSEKTPDKKASGKGEGPQLNAEEREDVVSGQDDVDDLLSSLGF
ncbi:chemotaxis phosphatase CheZ [Tamilnaduibacter salinus]|uniref:Protein phosphatase CheZ n=1 Tax=Tamilnaduibacter salinus TaxID=1484056 RepID=A0A2A2I8A5_9GAMM|nr:protein phosphatase CheZ [Tamilnaduibacter salinus]PAV27355.1 protein phosphatase [Tamilnaduibacter salinus]PVY79272.1 chemotaxis phosphatase CheZ [Tamilnaduibacter salinus]